MSSLIVDYAIKATKVTVENATFVPIEFLSWECLTVGALGWGQIQIANANVVKIVEGYARKKWMIELCDIMLEFYPREIEKIGERTEYFKRVRKRWVERKE